MSKKPKFKVGDKVRILKHRTASPYPKYIQVGMVGKIANISDSTLCSSYKLNIRVELLRLNCSCYFSEKELKIIKEKTNDGASKTKRPIHKKTTV